MELHKNESNPAETIEALKKVQVFSALGDKELAALASSCEKRLFSEGTVVFEVGSPGDCLFVVVKGKVDIANEVEGLRNTIAELVPGDSFGELELLTSTPRNASATAEGETELLAFPRRGLGFDEVLTKHPSASARLLFEFLDSTAHRIRDANALIKENSPLVQELKRQVYGDKLTGLFNKTYFEEKLSELAQLPQAKIAILMFKPDNFKEINDRFGHEAGDNVLKLVAAELARSLGEGDLAFRYMGNELAAILPGKDRAAALSEARRLMGILTAIDIKGQTGGADLRLSFSFGVGLFPDHASEALALIAIVHELPLAGRARGGNLILFPEDAQ